MPGHYPCASPGWVSELPPLPPHIEIGQAKKLMASILKGAPERWHVIRESAKQMWAGVIA